MTWRLWANLDRVTQWSNVERHDTFGEPNVKTGDKEMENQQEAVNMMMMFEWMLQEQHKMLEITSVVQWLVQRNEQFNGNGVSR